MSSTFLVGDRYVGVRSNTAEVDALLRSALRRYHVPDVEAPANYSVRIEQHTGQVRPLHQLYKASAPVVRAAIPSRVLRALVTYLASHLDGDDRHLRLHALPLVRDGEAVLVPRPSPGLLRSALEGRLRRRGFQVLDLPYAPLDPLTGELVVDGHGLEIDDDSLTALDPPVRRGAASAVPRTRYAVTGWVALARTDDSAVTPARRLGALLDLTLNRGSLGAGRTMSALAGMLPNLRVAEVSHHISVDGVLAALAELDAQQPVA